MAIWVEYILKVFRINIQISMKNNFFFIICIWISNYFIESLFTKYFEYFKKIIPNILKIHFNFIFSQGQLKSKSKLKNLK